MTLIAYLPLMFALLGLMIYGFVPGKAQEIGRLMFACGWLVTMFSLASKVLKLP